MTKPLLLHALTLAPLKRQNDHKHRNTTPTTPGHKYNPPHFSSSTCLTPHPQLKQQHITTTTLHLTTAAAALNRQPGRHNNNRNKKNCHISARKGRRRRRREKMYRDVSSCNTYNYGDSLYWDARYNQEAGNFDWYQRYSSLRPFVRRFVPTSSRVLMVGCGNALMSEDMVKDGYEDIMNIDISSVAIDLMKKRYEYTPELKYMEMDVRDMSFFPDESFDSVIDKGTLDSLMCGNDASLSASQMLGEVSRLLKPGGTYMLITYGDPRVRMPHLTRSRYNWKILLYIIPRPGFESRASASAPKSYLEPVPINEVGLLPSDFVLEDPDSHFIYVCKKTDEKAELGRPPNYQSIAEGL